RVGLSADRHRRLIGSPALREGRLRSRTNQHRQERRTKLALHGGSYSLVSNRMFSQVMSWVSLTPCDKPAGIKTTSPGLMTRSMPPRIEAPLKSPLADRVPPTRSPPVTSVPEPSVTTHTSAVFGCTSGRSGDVSRRMLTLYLPPSTRRSVSSFFASMSL